MNRERELQSGEKRTVFINITDLEDLEKILAQERAIVVFGAAGCQSCFFQKIDCETNNTFSETVAELRIKAIYVDTTKAPEIATNLKIMSVPQTRLYDRDQQTKEFLGYTSSRALIHEMRNMFDRQYLQIWACCAQSAR